MAENVQRSKGRPAGYKLDRGGAPAESGPYLGEVMNNVDPTRSGRVQVWIEDFAGSNKQDQSLWRTVSYVSPFYGGVGQTGTTQGTGNYVGNPQSYGMWMTTPDVGAQVVCFFASGDPNQGYYIGSVIQPGLNHMLPAIGATTNYNLDNKNQDTYFKGASRLPVTEINAGNQGIDENPRFFDQKKPVHSVVAGTLLQQGLVTDPIRGTINSNSQRESPSTVFGFSTPGRPIYAGGLPDKDIQTKLEKNEVTPEQAKILGRKGGHSFVMDDGDLKGQDAQVRIRTAKGHQILMSDSGDCFYIIHANGQTWLEFGQEGTIDVYSSNSINMRSQGDINIHADKNININANGMLNMYGKKQLNIESEMLNLTGKNALIAGSDKYIGLKSDGALCLDGSKSGTFNGGSNMTLSAGCIALNGGKAPSVNKPKAITVNKLPNTVFKDKTGWVVEQGKIETIVTRAPTHEPYPYHNKGTTATTSLSPAETTEPTPKVATKTEEIKTETPTTTIDAGDYAKQPQAEFSLGTATINPQQVTGMAAQMIKETDQSFDEVSLEKGVGKYGFSPQQLEDGGYLKPGTVEIYIEGNPDYLDIISSPVVWTGKGGVTSLAQVLNDSALQDTIQYSLYQAAYEETKAAGLLLGSEAANVMAPIVQVVTKYGLARTKSWLDNIDISSGLVTEMNVVARNAQFAVDLVEQKLTPAELGLNPSTFGSSNTTSRAVVDKAVSDVIGNDKVNQWSYTASGLTPDQILKLESTPTTYDTNVTFNLSVRPPITIYQTVQGNFKSLNIYDLANQQIFSDLVTEVNQIGGWSPEAFANSLTSSAGLEAIVKRLYKTSDSISGYFFPTTSLPTVGGVWDGKIRPLSTQEIVLIVQEVISLRESNLQLSQASISNQRN